MSESLSAAQRQFYEDISQRVAEWKRTGRSARGAAASLAAQHLGPIVPIAERSLFAPLARGVGREGEPLSYLDSAATCLSPDCVIEETVAYERESRSNVHRGVHVLAEESTDAYEGAREAVARFAGTDAAHLAFTRGATDSINIAAASLTGWLESGDAIVACGTAHHSNLVPWQMLAKRTGARLAVVHADETGALREDEWARSLELAPKVVALTFGSNVLGFDDATRRRVREAHDAGALVLVDCAQRVGHGPLDLAALAADFAAWSAHKMYGPMGIGALFCSDAALERMEPPIGGGGAVVSVGDDGFEVLPFPQGLEPGTPAVGAAVGFAAAARFLQGLEMERVQDHDVALAQLACDRLAALGFVHVMGDAGRRREGIVSFSVEGVHPHDVAQVLSDGGVAVRAGHHCAMPLHARLRVPASVRASFGVYNGQDDIERLIAGVRRAKELFG